MVAYNWYISPLAFEEGQKTSFFFIFGLYNPELANEMGYTCFLSWPPFYKADSISSEKIGSF